MAAFHAQSLGASGENARQRQRGQQITPERHHQRRHVKRLGEIRIKTAVADQITVPTMAMRYPFVRPGHVMASSCEGSRSAGQSAAENTSRIGVTRTDSSTRQAARPDDAARRTPESASGHARAPAPWH